MEPRATGSGGEGGLEERGIEQLAQAMIALRSTADVGTACSIV